MKIEDLFRFNEWWETGKVSEKYLEPYKRYLFGKILKFIEDRQIILITGLRRVGKTRLMYQLIHTLLERGADKRKILYFSFDEEAFDLKDVLETYKKEVLRKEFKEAEKVYVFLDEIQKIDNWEGKIKVYYDLSPNIKFILSGSAALLLSKKAKESLAGRMYEFVLKPLTFKEFLEMKNVNVKFEDMRLLNEKIQPVFSDFLIKAGFPEITEEDDEEKIRDYIKLAVIDRIIYRDIPSQFGRTDIELLEKLTDMFFKNPGFILNYENLAMDLGRDKKTIINYVYYLRFSSLLNLVSNFRISIRSASRKNKKVYPATTSIVFSSYGRFDSRLLGRVLETAFCSDAGARYYFRKGGKEIDFIIIRGEKTIPVEVKYSLSKNDIKAYTLLLKKMHIEKGIFLTMGDFGEFSENRVKIFAFPLWAFLVFAEEILEKM